MYNVCARMLNDGEEARDVLQESFITAFKNIGQFKGDGTFGAWLKRIVINKTLDTLRKKNVTFISLENNDFSDTGEMEEPAESYSIETILRSISLLPDGYRVILN